ncbi:MAG: multiheme c-type cytochrome, partial [Bacteroidota bacterium]
QAGGLTRRATAVKRLRAFDVPSLLVDTGGIFDGETPVDRLRSQTYLRGMAQIGYDAVLLTASEFRFGLEFLEAAKAQTQLPFLSSNLLGASGDPFVTPYFIKQVGSQKVALLGISDELPESASPQPPKLGGQGGRLSLFAPNDTLRYYLPVVQKEADLIILLSALDAGTNRQLARDFPQITLILTHPNDEGEREGEAPAEPKGEEKLAFASRHGKKLGLAWWDGEAVEKASPPTLDAIVLSDDIPDDAAIREQLTTFYQQVASDPQLQRPTKLLFAAQPLEGDANNGYVGSEACQTCHTDEYNQWETTMHAAAFYTLLQVQKHFYPDCVSCHSTGFGYPSGYAIGNEERKHLQGIGCETCHGPGKKHVSNPSRNNTRREVEITMCAQCHSAEHHPGFLEVASLLKPEVDHSRERLDLRAMLQKKVKGTVKPEVELFVMSFCPPGTEAEKRLIPILREFGDSVQFRLRFIAEEEGENFKSLHGQAEVEEDIRQLVIEKYYPEKLFDYLLCRVKDLKRSWQPCAESVGLDVQRIDAIAQSAEGRELFQQNIR